MSAYQNTPYRVLCQLVINANFDTGITFDDFYQAAIRDQSVRIDQPERVLFNARIEAAITRRRTR